MIAERDLTLTDAGRRLVDSGDQAPACRHRAGAAQDVGAQSATG